MAQTRQPITDQDRFFELMSGEKIVLHPMQRRVRAMYNGAIIADTENPELGLEVRDYERRAQDIRDDKFWMGHSFYGWPLKDIKPEFFIKSDEVKTDPRVGTGSWYHIRVGNRMIKRSAWVWDGANELNQDLTGLMFINDLALDALFEEEDEITGPRNPYHGVEVRTTSKHVRITLDDVEIANSRNARMLFETGLPVRYYLPKQDVRMDLLTPKDITSMCPYKGHAEYWDVTVNGTTHEGVVWSYTHPYPNVGKIEHLLGFYEERGMTIYVDGIARATYQPATLKGGFLLKPQEDGVDEKAPVPADGATCAVGTSQGGVVEELPADSTCACTI